MRFILTLVACLLASVLAQTDSELLAGFNAYALKFGKVYTTDAERTARFENYKASLTRIAALNERNPTAKFGLTKFSDMSDAEKRNYVGRKTSAAAAVTACLAKGVDASHDRFMGRKFSIPTSFDWRTQGKISPVKDQGQCGSCWTFSTTGAMESSYAVKHNVNATTVVSEQAIVDCSTGCAPEDGQSVCNQGCDGGWPWTATSDIITFGGLPTEAAYPYTAVDGTCSISGKKLILKPSNYSCLSGPNQNAGPADEATQMPTWLMKNGALSIALNAGLFFDYTSGILNPTDPSDNCEGTNLDHAVLIVGWGVESNVPYWIVKNSWGASWGENGYIRMYRGNGLCGLNAAVMAITF